MSEFSRNEKVESQHSDGSHRRKRKRRHQKKIYRQIIIALIFLAICAGALVAWHMLVQDSHRGSPVTQARVPARIG